jgi:hypothetical protein
LELLRRETFPLVPLIEDIAKTIEPMATKNGNRLVIDCPADLGTIHAWFDFYNPSTADRGGQEGRPISTLFCCGALGLLMAKHWQPNVRSWRKKLT